MSALAAACERVAGLRLAQPVGAITRSAGLLLEAAGPPARVGEKCLLEVRAGCEPAPCEVVGFSGHRLLIMPFRDIQDVGVGSRVIATGEPVTIRVGDSLLGRVVDGLGEPIDGGPVPADTCSQPVEREPPAALQRRAISRPLPLGVRAIDGLLTCGVGQRMGIFAGPGVGKSTLLGMIARNTRADVNVIALIGERGREVGEFIQGSLGPAGLQRSVVVVATGDQPPVLVVRAAQVATAIAEYFRDQGRDVLLMMDSITRFAWAQREIGLATGEPPTRGGYTPSVFAALPRLLERGGNSDRGSITTLCTVLVDGNDMDEPVASAVRAILDGHIILSPRLAAAGHFPAIDVPESVSRVMPQVAGEHHMRMAREIRACIAAYRESEDLINLGAYVRGSSAAVDRAITLKTPIDIFLQQARDERTGFEDTVGALEEILSIPEASPVGTARKLQNPEQFADTLAGYQELHGPTTGGTDAPVSLRSGNAAQDA